MASLEDLPIETLAQIAQLNNAMANNPATRTDYLKLIKRISPNTVIPELDAAAPIMTALAEERSKREALEAKIQADEIRRNIQEKRAKTAKEHKLTDDQMVEVEKLMTDNQIPNYDTAAQFYTMQRKAAVPTTHEVFNPGIQMPDENVWKPGIGNKAMLDKIARQQAYGALNEINGISGS